MIKAANKMNWTMKGEEKASHHINILAHYDDDTLLDKSGKLIQIIKLEGIHFVTQDEQSLDHYKNRRNNVLKSFSSEFAVYFWELRRKVICLPEGDFKEGFTKDVNQEYQKKLSQTEMYSNDLYLAVMTKPPEGIINFGFNVFQQLNRAVDKAERASYLIKCHKELGSATRKIMSALAEYKPELLSVYEKNTFRFSAPLEFLSQLINFEKQSMPHHITDASIALPTYRLFFNAKIGTIETRMPDGRKRFSAILSIKNYQSITYQGMLDEISALKMEYTLTQSFRFYDRQIAKTKLRDQQKEMRQTKDESVTQTEEISEAFDDAASGEVGYGAHHFTLMCYADSQEELNKHIALLVAKFSDIDVVSIREDVGCEGAFWAQLPGNFGYIFRSADISTKNFSSFMSLHNHVKGKANGNHWGHAVTLFETPSGSPYYFNFHYKDVGNFLVFGAMGSGKTVLVGFLILQSMKFGGKRVIFDKDRGLEILIRAMNGTREV